MATRLFLNSSTAPYSTGNNDPKLNGTASGWSTFQLTTAAGNTLLSAAANTVTGPTAGVEGLRSSIPVVFISDPLDADVTISGSITWNLYAGENNMSANVAINGQIEVVDGATGTITLIDKTARTTELGTTGRILVNFSETPGAGVACKRGDRLRVRLFGDDVGTMATGFSFDYSWGKVGDTAGDGNTWVELTENLTFVSEPAGSQIFLTDSAPGVSTASDDRLAWTTRGVGVIPIPTDTTAGWTAPIQMTSTAGGVVCDWFTRELTAFTLGGAVRVNARASESNILANAALRCEIARVASDGTSPTVWAAGTYDLEVSTSESALNWLIAGDDLAISDQQRLRIRFYIDDLPAAAMAALHTVTLYFAGTIANGSGDTHVTFTQSLTEYVAGGAENIVEYIGGGYYG